MTPLTDLATAVEGRYLAAVEAERQIRLGEYGDPEDLLFAGGSTTAALRFIRRAATLSSYWPEYEQRLEEFRRVVADRCDAAKRARKECREEIRSVAYQFVDRDGPHTVRFKSGLEVALEADDEVPGQTYYVVYAEDIGVQVD